MPSLRGGMAFLPVCKGAKRKPPIDHIKWCKLVPSVLTALQSARYMGDLVNERLDDGLEKIRVAMYPMQATLRRIRLKRTRPIREGCGHHGPRHHCDIKSHVGRPDDWSLYPCYQILRDNSRSPYVLHIYGG